MQSNLIPKETLCQCPICKVGNVIALYDPHPDEPYLHKLPTDLVCENCGQEFQSIILDKNRTKCEMYKVVE